MDIKNWHPFLVFLTVTAAFSTVDDVTVSSVSGLSSLPNESNAQPCSLGKSILFTQEDVPIGTEVLRIPSMSGEVWTLTENGPLGYLELRHEDDYNQVVFARTPDIEDINKLDSTIRESMSFILQCSYNGWKYKFRQELIIQDVNEHPPEFDVSRSYNMTISENSAVGTTIFSLRNLAKDPDITGRVAGYVLRPYSDSLRDGRRFFRISEDGASVVLYQPVDYDTLQKEGGGTVLTLNVTAMDNGSPRPLTSHALMHIRVTDTDDQGPVFWYPDCPLVAGVCATPYFQTVTKCGFKGILRLYPGPVRAKDTDSLNSSISYSIERVEPDEFSQHFEIDSETGDVRAIKTSCAASIDEVIITIKAKENYFYRRSITTTLQITILDNLVLPRRTWDIPHLMNELSQDKKDKKNESPHRSLPLLLFVISIFGFIAIGGGLAFVAVRISRARRRKRSLDSVSKSSLDCSISDCGNCGRSNKTEGTITNAFSACSGSSSLDHNASIFHHSSDNEGENTGQSLRNSLEPQDLRGNEIFHIDAHDVTKANANILGEQEEKHENDAQFHRQEYSNQHHKKQEQSLLDNRQSVKQPHFPQQSRPDENDHQVPFTQHEFSQRRNLFQQQEGHANVNCGRPIPPPPPVKRQKIQDQHFNQSNSQQQHFDQSWADHVDHSATSGQPGSSGLVSGKAHIGLFPSERENPRNYTKKSTSFREHLNEMVPECLKVSNNNNYINSNIDQKQSDHPGEDNEIICNGNLKVRFNLPELSSI